MADNQTQVEYATDQDDETGPTDSSPVLKIDSLIKDFGDLRAVDVPELSLHDGEFFTLLGPSGSGKSTLLRMIAGLETPSQGTINLNGTDVTTVSANARPTALIFQDFQLFPHKTVGENIAFPLKMRGVPKDERRSRTNELLEFVDLEGYQDRYPDQLSGGEQQRVSLARGLISEPDVLLLDEPLASLDRNLRDQLQVELRKFQRRAGITFIYVTHNQEVALTMSDRVAVMDDGHVEQVGHPMTVYNEPESEFVAKFIGEVNTVHGTVEQIDGTDAVLSHNGVSLAGRAGGPLTVGDDGVFCIKSEGFSLGTGPSDAEHTFTGTLNDQIFTGKNINYLVDPDDIEINAAELIVSEASDDKHDVAVGDSVTVSWEPTDAHIFPEEE